MVCRFNADFAALSAQQFVDGVLLNGLRTRHLIIGDDFRFGKGRAGDFAMLQAAWKKNDKKANWLILGFSAIVFIAVEHGVEQL